MTGLAQLGKPLSARADVSGHELLVGLPGRQGRVDQRPCLCVLVGVDVPVVGADHGPGTGAVRSGPGGMPRGDFGPRSGRVGNGWCRCGCGGRPEGRDRIWWRRRCRRSRMGDEQPGRAEDGLTDHDRQRPEQSFHDHSLGGPAKAGCACRPLGVIPNQVQSAPKQTNEQGGSAWVARARASAGCVPVLSVVVGGSACVLPNSSRDPRDYLLRALHVQDRHELGNQIPHRPDCAAAAPAARAISGIGAHSRRLGGRLLDEAGGFVQAVTGLDRGGCGGEPLVQGVVGEQAVQALCIWVSVNL